MARYDHTQSRWALRDGCVLRVRLDKRDGATYLLRWADSQRGNPTDDRTEHPVDRLRLSGGGASPTLSTRSYDAGIEVKPASSVSRGQAISEGHLGSVILILLELHFPWAVVGVLDLASTMSAIILDRPREFGVGVGAR